MTRCDIFLDRDAVPDNSQRESLALSKHPVSESVLWANSFKKLIGLLYQAKVEILSNKP